MALPTLELLQQLLRQKQIEYLEKAMAMTSGNLFIINDLSFSEMEDIREWVRQKDILKDAKAEELRLRNEIIDLLIKKKEERRSIRIDDGKHNFKINDHVNGDTEFNLTVELKTTEKIDDKIESDYEELDEEDQECFRVKTVYAIDAKKYKARKAWCEENKEYFLIDDYITETPAQATLALKE